LLLDHLATCELDIEHDVASRNDEDCDGEATRERREG
jgi:hypothetical protein